jgi:hypothetical protein
MGDRGRLQAIQALRDRPHRFLDSRGQDRDDQASEADGEPADDEDIPF